MANARFKRTFQASMSRLAPTPIALAPRTWCGVMFKCHLGASCARVPSDRFDRTTNRCGTVGRESRTPDRRWNRAVRRAAVPAHRRAVYGGSGSRDWSGYGSSVAGHVRRLELDVHQDGSVLEDMQVVRRIERERVCESVPRVEEPLAL